MPTITVYVKEDAYVKMLNVATKQKKKVSKIAQETLEEKFG